MSADVFDSLIHRFRLIRANTEEYYGEINDQPAILTVLSASPPAIMFKIRINSEDEVGMEWPDALSELLADKKINVSVENGYGWLTVYDLSDFDVEAVDNLVVHFMQTVEDYGLSLGLGCAVCGNSNPGEIYYSDGNVDRLCANCLEARRQQRSDEHMKSSQLSTSAISWCLLGVAGFAIAWALIWFVYDYVFILYGTDSIDVPDVVLGGGGLVVVAALSMTIGLPLRRFGIGNKVILMITASIVATVSFVLGEILLSIMWVFKNVRAIEILASIRYCIFVWTSEPTIFEVVKIMLVIGSVIGVGIIAKKKKVAIDI